MTSAEFLARLAAWAINAAFLGWLTLWVWRVLRSHQPSVDAVLLVFLAIFNTTVFTLAIGLAGVLRPVPIAALSLVGAVCLLAVPEARSSIHGFPHLIRSLQAGVSSFWSSLPPWLRWLTVFATIISLIRFAFLILVLPPFVWDSLTYHLTNVAHWVQAGRIELFDAPVVRIYTPANYEVLAAWFTVFLHHDVVIEAAGLPAYGLAIAAVYAGARQLGVSRPSAWLGAMAYASTPALLLAVTGTKNDPHAASYFLTALVLILYLGRVGSDQRGRGVLGPLVALVLVLLLAFDTKAYILHLLPGLAVVAAGAAWSKGPFRHWLSMGSEARTEIREAANNRRGVLVVLLLAGLFVGTYWNARNWVLTGNPFYPYSVAVEGSQLLPEGDHKTQMDVSLLRENLSMLADRFGDRTGPIRPDLPDTTGWGWFAYSFGLATSLWAILRRQWPVLILLLGFAVSFLVLMTSTPPDSWSMRYAIWFPAAFSFAFAAWVDQQSDVASWVRLGTWAGFVACLSLNGAMTLNYNRVPIAQFEDLLNEPTLARKTADLGLGIPPEYGNALGYVGADDVLGYNVHNNGFIYPLFRQDFSQRLVYVPVQPTDSCPRIEERMRARGTRYLFVAPGHTDDRVRSRLNQCEAAGEIADPVPGVYIVLD